MSKLLTVSTELHIIFLSAYLYLQFFPNWPFSLPQWTLCFLNTPSSFWLQNFVLYLSVEKICLFSSNYPISKVGFWNTSSKTKQKLRYADDTPLMAESEEELKSLLMRVKEESEKSGLKLSIQKTKIMASSPFMSWQIDGEKWKQWQILFSWSPKSL